MIFLRMQYTLQVLADVFGQVFFLLILILETFGQNCLAVYLPILMLQGIGTFVDIYLGRFFQESYQLGRSKGHLQIFKL